MRFSIPMTVEIHISHDDDAQRWDTIISQSPHGTIFHSWKWLKIIEKHTQSMLYPLVGIKNGIPIGVFPLFFQKKGPIRMVFSPPPHVSLFYLGPVLVGYDKLTQEKREVNYIEFQKSAENFIKNELKPNYINIVLSPNLQDPRPFTWLEYSTELHFDYVIDLSCGLDKLLQTLDKRRRQNLILGKKRGISVEIGGKKEYETILDLMEIRYAQQGKISTTPRDYYLDIYEAFKDNIKIFVAKVDCEVLTGNIDIQYRDTHYSWIGNPKPTTAISPSPNDLLIWAGVKHAYERGFKYYVTMNAAGNKRLYSYYASKFDPALKVHFSAKKSSFISGMLEMGYMNILKPIQGQLKNKKY